MPQDVSDVVNTLIPLTYQSDTPLITLSMGPIGQPSRIIALALRSFLSFGFVEGGKPAGPGQIPIGKMRNAKEAFGRRLIRELFEGQPRLVNGSAESKMAYLYEVGQEVLAEA